jgi:hypothetical protein
MLPGQRPVTTGNASAASTLALLALLLPGCNGNGSTADCVTGLSTACAPLYPPTFDQVFSRTLAPTCAQPGGVCHASTGVQGGLLFITPDDSYALLLGESGSAPRVVPGNPACSLLVERIYATDPDKLMPPKAPLSDAERCAIVQWIAGGAKR